MDAFLTAIEHHGWTVFWLLIGFVYLLNNLPYRRCRCCHHEDEEEE